MALTPEEKINCIEVMNANVPTDPSLVDGQYVMVLPITVAPVTCGMWVYSGPPGVGYIRWTKQIDDADTNLMHQFRVHTGPESYYDQYDGWAEYNPSQPGV